VGDHQVEDCHLVLLGGGIEVVEGEIGVVEEEIVHPWEEVGNQVVGEVCVIFLTFSYPIVGRGPAGAPPPGLSSGSR
jgi:hypothetical protein